jgi:hypothetical protein
MNRSTVEKIGRDSSSLLRNSNRRYIRKGLSSDPPKAINRSNQDLTEIIPHFEVQNNRYSDHSGKILGKINKKLPFYSDQPQNLDFMGL